MITELSCTYTMRSFRDHGARGSAGGGAGEAEAAEDGAVEAGHRADPAAREGEHQQPDGVRPPGPRVAGVKAERRLAVRPGRRLDQRGGPAGRNAVAARNRPASSRPWYSSG